MEVVQAILDLPWWTLVMFFFKAGTAYIVAMLPFIVIGALCKAALGGD